MRTIAATAASFAAGVNSARAVVEECIARIQAPGGEGARVFVQVYADQARQMADAMDGLRRAGRAPSPYAGIPISLKDLFDVAGEPTAAGSRVLADAAPAAAHAPIVQRLLAAGFIPVGRTNMTEFAFSGLGINPHYGTPRNPWGRTTGRIPGGSSSGAAVSVTDGFALGALGTDTGGSCRLPAALCGIVGYKPTARRVPIEGVLPLAPSLDSVGPLAGSVSCCAILDAVIAGDVPREMRPASLAGLRLAVPSNVVMEGVDEFVAAAFERALRAISHAGAVIEPMAFPVLDDIPEANRGGGFAAAEGFAWHRGLLATAADGYDPRIRRRIERGAGFSAADYIALVANRGRLIARMNADTAEYDALVMPTAPIVASAIADLDDEAAYNRINMLLLRNTSFGNFLDRCAISLPCHREGEAPVGLMLMGKTMGDTRLFDIATAIEDVLQ
jgi:aspartyl-tRNA(Asn)/glutamyl-tRNA(Gln) amidotransferase subunit A